MTAQTKTQAGFDLKGKLYRLQVGKRVLIGISLLVFTFFTLFPFFWMALTAFRPGTDFYKVAREPFKVTGITLSQEQLAVAVKVVPESLAARTQCKVIEMGVGDDAEAGHRPGSGGYGRLRNRDGAFLAGAA